MSQLVNYMDDEMSINVVTNSLVTRRVSILVVCATCLSATVCTAKDEYTFGVVPQQAASKLARTWGPILKYLEDKTGNKFRFETAKNIPVFEENLANGTYDFAYMNPHHYVVYHRHSGYEAYARAKGKSIHGIIVVRKDSPIKTIADLNNSVLAFPSPLAFAATLITRSELTSQKINVAPRYVSSHDSVYRNVAEGNFVAGGGIIRTFKDAADEVRSKLRILYKTKGYTPHAFAVKPDVPAKVRESVVQAMLAMEKSTTGKELLESLQIRGIVSAKDKDWDDVREIRY